MPGLPKRGSWRTPAFSFSFRERGSDRGGGECSLMGGPFSKATDLPSGATVALPGTSVFTAVATSHNVAFSPLTLTRVVPSRLNARPPPPYPLNAPCSRPVCASQNLAPKSIVCRRRNHRPATPSSVSQNLGPEYIVLPSGKNESPPPRSSTGLPDATSHSRVTPRVAVASFLLSGLNERGWPSSAKRNPA